MSFSNYYQKEIERYGGTKKYILAKANEKEPLLSRVIKYSNNGTILEAGSGSSSNSIHLANEGHNVISIDVDPKILTLAKNLSESFKNKPRFLKKEISKFHEKCSVVFSHGVLEHFEDKEIINLINKELEIGRYTIFSIPSDFFRQNQAINGDERFMSRKKWRSLISKTDGTIVEEFSYFYDPDNIKLKILKFIFKITKGILPIKKPYIGFVVRKNVHYS